MKLVKRITKTRRFMAFAIMLMLSLGSISTTVSATPNPSSASDNTMRSRTVYYPSSGVASGNFTGVWSSSCTYSSLPKGTIHISYSYISANTADTIRFYNSSGSLVDYAFLSINNGNPGNATVNLPSSGSYRVQVWSNSSGDEKIYAFNLFTEN